MIVRKQIRGDYNGMMATIYLISAGMEKTLIDGMNTSSEDCIPLSEVDL
ncbi:MAG: hypothetical protein PHT39_09070 [Sphaerochaetaceae bacterium]|jgi:hypothetical protein|nr:hypothetical protein [Sphaerochaetaceae bacterium]MDD4397709.1 hypothetical protein [Sphaerochaetaceae bacterium]